MLAWCLAMMRKATMHSAAMKSGVRGPVARIHAKSGKSFNQLAAEVSNGEER